MTDRNDLDVVVLDCPKCGERYDYQPFAPPHVCAVGQEGVRADGP